MANHRLNKQDFDRAINGAIAFAAADRSDPFARNRAISHVHNGLVTRDHKTGELLGYQAEQTMETRTIVIDGETREYKVPTFINVKRP